MQHKLVQQLKKRVEVLTVVKERILTTNRCFVTQTKKGQCDIHGILRLVGMLGSSIEVGKLERPRFKNLISQTKQHLRRIWVFFRKKTYFLNSEGLKLS